MEVAESFSHLVLNVLHNLVLSGPWFTFSRVRSHMAFHGDLGQPFGTERADAPVGKWGGAHVQADPASWVEVAESFSHLVLNVLHNLALQTINPLPGIHWANLRRRVRSHMALHGDRRQPFGTERA